MRASVLLFIVAPAILLAGCSNLTLRVNPVRISATGSGVESSIVTAKLRGEQASGQEMVFTVLDGEECGTLSTATASTDATGRATVTFTGSTGVENCVALIEARLGDEFDATVRVTVNPPPPTTRIDGVSALVVVIIASFAIDRIVRGLLFLLGFWPRWRTVFPEADDASAEYAARKRSRLIYFLFAGFMGIVVISWYGNVRILGALGFQTGNTALDIIITGLILVGGAERTEAILNRFASGSKMTPSTPGATTEPIEITGTLVLERTGKLNDRSSREGIGQSGSEN